MSPPNPVGSWADVLHGRARETSLGPLSSSVFPGLWGRRGWSGAASALWADVSHVLFLSSHFQGCLFSAEEDKLVRQRRISLGSREYDSGMHLRLHPSYCWLIRGMFALEGPGLALVTLGLWHTCHGQLCIFIVWTSMLQALVLMPSHSNSHPLVLQLISLVCWDLGPFSIFTSGTRTGPTESWSGQSVSPLPYRAIENSGPVVR